VKTDVPKESTADATRPTQDQSRYEPPLLRYLGDLRHCTLGGSLGTGDSGNSGVQRF